MGCNIYEMDGQHVMFSEHGDEFWCLCTEKLDGDMGIEIIRSLALLGAAALLAWRRAREGITEDWMYIPNCIPREVLDAVRRIKLRER